MTTTATAAPSIFTPAAPGALPLAEHLWEAMRVANIAEPYVPAAYDRPCVALTALLECMYGPEHGARVYDVAGESGESIRSAVAYVETEARAAAADAYDTATLWQAEHDAMAAYDAVAAGTGDPAEHLRTFAAATAHLDAQGCFIVLNPDGAGSRIMDEDDAAARFVGAMDLVTADDIEFARAVTMATFATAHLAPCGEDFATESDADDHEATCGECAGATDTGEVAGFNCYPGRCVPVRRS